MNHSGPGPRDEPLTLRVELELGIPQDSTCPLFNRVPGEPKSVDVNNHYGTCYLEVELDDCDDDADCTKMRFEQEIDDCSCPAFWKHGCFPTILSVTGRTAIVEVFIPDRGTLRELVAAVRETGQTVTVRKLSTVDDEDAAGEFRIFDVTHLTDREHEILDFAVKSGYYDRDRAVRLQDIADEFGISKQAGSERLNAAESKMAHDLFD